MSNQSAAVNVHAFVRKIPPAQTEDASDPVPVMRRQITLLNIEVEHLRAKEDEARKVKEFLVEYVEWVEQLRENRDEWQREAERRSAVMGQVPHWVLLWARGRLNVSRAWRQLTAFRNSPSHTRDLISPTSDTEQPQNRLDLISN
jgi:hypothetical protein